MRKLRLMQGSVFACTYAPTLVFFVSSSMPAQIDEFATKRVVCLYLPVLKLSPHVLYVSYTYYIERLIRVLPYVVLIKYAICCLGIA